MSKVLKFFKYIIILFVCIVLLVSCIGAGIIMADKYKNQEYPFEDVAEVQSINYPPVSTRSTITEINNSNNSLKNTIWTFNNLITVPATLPIPPIPTSDNYTFNISFTSNNTSFSSLNLTYNVNGLQFIRYDSTEVYRSSAFLEGAYHTICITSIDSIDTDSLSLFTSWITENAIKIPNRYDEGYDEGYNEGYDEGYDEALQLARANVFSSSTKISAYVEEDNHILTSPVEILPNGVGFSEIAAEADTYMTKNEISDLKFTVSFQFEPFLFENNQIYISIAYGFRTLTLYDTDGNEYYMSWGDVKTDDGYAIFEAIGNTIIGKTITKAVIGFQGPDYVGDLLTPDYLSYENYYDNGYSDGYKNGYDVGVGETIGSLTGWDAVKNGLTSIFEALQIKVFGLFSLGDVIMICLVFAVVMFFLKVIRG